MANKFFRKLQTGGIQDLQNKGITLAKKVSQEREHPEQAQSQQPSYNQPGDMEQNNPQAPQGMHPEAEPEITEDDIENLDDDQYQQPSPTQNPATLAAMTMAKRNTRQPTKQSHAEEGQLTIDVYETPKAIVIKSVVAGVSANDLKITITPEHVSISGERRHEESVDDDAYFYQECFWGSFSRSISLPTEIDHEEAKASISKGVLMIVLPKLEKKGEKVLEIEEI